MKKSSFCAITLSFLVLPQHSPACGTSTITNLPTYGGALFQVNALSSLGQVVGSYYIPDVQDSHAFRYTNGVLTDVGTLGGRFSEGLAINSSGQIVGDSYLPDFNFHAFVAAGDSPVDLETRPATSSIANLINDAGQVAGLFFTQGDSDQRAFFYSSGVLSTINDLGGNFISVSALNNFGVVVGYSSATNGDTHAYAYSGGITSDLGTFGGTYSAAFGVNDAGTIVGEASLASEDVHAFAFANGVMNDLGTLGGTFSSTVAVNSNSDVLGYSTLTGDQILHAFLLSAGTLKDLGTLGGDYSFGSAFNNAGQVVGDSTLADGTDHAFVWQKGKMTDLNTLLPANSGWELFNARFINDAGRVVGDGALNGVAQPYILDLVAVNNPPVANAGPAQTQLCNAQSTLDGSGSTDPDGDPLAFEWSIGGTVLGTNAVLAVALPLGMNVVALKVTDPCGASSQATTVVQVIDPLPPTIFLPALAPVSAEAHCSAAVPNLLATAIVSDNCTPANLLKLVQEPAAGTVVGLGGHAVKVKATDSSGNSASASVLFTVLDTTAPVISNLNAAPASLWPPNHQLVPISVSLNASDSCDPSPLSKILSITCNEAVPAADIQITGNLTAKLAASKNASGPRVYTLTVQSTDASGNHSSKTVTVTVPVSNGKK